jgi:Tol biopolymer transport system component
MCGKWVRTLVLLAGTSCADNLAPVAPVASIEVTPLGAVWVGDVRDLHATLRDADGTVITGTLSWSSSDAQVVRVSAGGVLTALSRGTATIVATSGEARAEATVNISEMDLLYEGFPNGSSELMVLSLRGGEPSRVLPAGSIVTSPAASPDGSRIAFVAATPDNPTADIYIVNRDGSGLFRLTDAPEADDNPAWSPDGTRIAFRSYRGQQADVWAVDADGANLRNLTAGASSDDRRPTWSPDGSRIAFSSNRGGTFDIWTMRTDGTELYQLTKSAQYDTEPTWSVDGRIAFRRSDDNTSDIIVVNARGGMERRISLPGHELMPSWSPNGALLAFAYFVPGSPDPQIYTMRPDGAELTLRTTDESWKGGIEPRWLRH